MKHLGYFILGIPLVLAFDLWFKYFNASAIIQVAGSLVLIYLVGLGASVIIREFRNA